MLSSRRPSARKRLELLGRNAQHQAVQRRRHLDLAGEAARVLDLRGREVLRQDLHGMDQINISSLVVGSYTLMLYNSKGEMQERQRLSITR